MGRRRATSGGLANHVLNRAKARMPIFDTPGDYEALERIVQTTVPRTLAHLTPFLSLLFCFEGQAILLQRLGMRLST